MTDRAAGGGNVDDYAGRVLADRYRLLECIEKADGYSTWHATDEKLAHDVLPCVAVAQEDIVLTIPAARRIDPSG